MRNPVGTLLACSILFLDVAAARAAGEPPPTFQGKTAAEWVSVLEGQDLKGRQRAAWGLFNLAPGCAEAASPLARAVADPDEYVRTTAASALVRLGEGARSAMTVLAGLLASEDEAVRREAVSAVFRLGPLAAEIVSPLATALRSDDAQVRANAAACLGNAGVAAKEAAKALDAAVADGDPDVAKWAAKARAAVDPASAFAHAAKAVRLAAVGTVLDPGSPWDPGVLRTLLGRLGDEDAEVRSLAANALGNAALTMSPYPPELVAETLKALAARLGTDPEAAVRQWAAYALGYLGRAAGGETAREIGARLLAGTSDRDPEVRRECLRDLGWLGENAGPDAIPRLLKALGDPDAPTRSAAALSLGAIGDPRPEVIGALDRALADFDEDAVRSAVDALGAFGPKAAAAVADLADCLAAAERISVKVAVARTLARIGPAAKEAVPALEEARETEPRPEFDHALAVIDPSPERVRGLGAWMADENEVTVAVALALLLELKEAALPLLPDLVRTLDHRYQDARTNALRVIAALGPAAKSAAPAVRARLEDPNENVRSAARATLAALGEQ